jgi:hypothetical protein
MPAALSRRGLFGALTGVVGAAVLGEAVSAAPAGATAGIATPIQLLTPPMRIQDTRDGGTKLAGGSTLQVFVPGLIGQGIVGAFLNVTITETEGAGFLRVDAANATATNATSNVNWWGPGLTLANLVAVPAEGTRGIVVTAGGAGRTHVVIDLVGLLGTPP